MRNSFIIIIKKKKKKLKPNHVRLNNHVKV